MPSVEVPMFAPIFSMTLLIETQKGNFEPPLLKSQVTPLRFEYCDCQ